MGDDAAGYHPPSGRVCPERSGPPSFPGPLATPSSPRPPASEIRRMNPHRSRSSRSRHRAFVEDYKAQRLDALLEREDRPNAASPDGDGTVAHDSEAAKSE